MTHDRDPGTNRLAAFAHLEGGRVPDFLGIGTQRSGTTWLYACLSEHPELHLPRVKELHYFDDPPWAEHRPISSRISSRSFDDRRWRRAVLRQAADLARTGDVQLARWNVGYYLLPRDDDWYRQRFALAAGRVTGELTPDYSVLDVPTIQRAASLVPDARLVVLLRHPMERAWSGAVMWFLRRQRRPLEDVPTSEIIEHLRSRMSRERTAYQRILQRWRSSYPAERIFVGWYDDMVARPTVLLRRLHEHLGVDPDVPTPSVAWQAVHSGPSRTIPAAAAACLAELYLDEVEELAGWLGGPAVAWAEHTRRVADGRITGDVPLPYWRADGAAGWDRLQQRDPHSAVLSTIEQRPGRHLPPSRGAATSAQNGLAPLDEVPDLPEQRREA